MKIIVNNQYRPKTVSFEDLEAGEVFRVAGQSDFHLRANGVDGATRLRDGAFFTSWSADTMCTVYNAELVLEEQYE